MHEGWAWGQSRILDLDSTATAGWVQMFENSFRELPFGKNMVPVLNLFSFRRWLWSRGRGWGKERSNRREWEERVREWRKTDQFEPVILTPWIPAAVFLLPPPLDPKFAFKTSSFSHPQQVCWLLSVDFFSCGIWGKPGGGFQGISLKSWAKSPPNRTMFLMYSFRRGAEMLTLKWWLF